MGDRRALWRDALAADHVAAPVLLAPYEDRRLAERAVEMWLDDLQGEPGGRRGVKRIAALFENAHANRRGNPMGRGDGAKGAADLGSGGKIWQCLSSGGRLLLRTN